MVFAADITAGPPTQLTLAPGSATTAVGSAISFSASVRDAAGLLVIDATNPVTFSASGVAGTFTPASPVLPVNGVATVSFTPTAAGSATITASATGLTSDSASLTVTTDNPITLENLKPGTTAWEIITPVSGSTPEIAGYADATSYALGDTVNFKVAQPSPGGYRIDVYRLGYYAGDGGRRVYTSGALSGTLPSSSTDQPDCLITDPDTLLIECRWETSHSTQVTADWTTGMYVANLTDNASGRQSQIWFVVREDVAAANASAMVFKVAFANYLAYNHYGSNQRHSLYEFNSTNNTRAFKVSFDRPFGQVTTEQLAYNNMLDYEYRMVRWLESQGYDVSYISDIDVEVDPSRLLDHDVFLSIGHDEYWSLTMRDAAEAARDAGVHLAFLSANTAYWRVRYEPSTGGPDGVRPNRVMVSYKDPNAGGSGDPVAPTYLWRGPENNRPENALMGVMYVGDDVFNQFGGYDHIVSNANDPYYANTGLSNGDRLTGLVGYEWDAVVNNGATPPGTGRFIAVDTERPRRGTGAAARHQLKCIQHGALHRRQRRQGVLDRLDSVDVGSGQLRHTRAARRPGRPAADRQRVCRHERAAGHPRPRYYRALA